MKVMHMAFDRDTAISIQLEVEKKGFDYVFICMKADTFNYDNLFEYDLIVIDSDNTIDELDGILRTLFVSESATIPIIIISNQIDFHKKSHFYDLGTMAVMCRTELSDGRFSRYLETILKEKQAIETLSKLNIAVIDDSRFYHEIVRSIFIKYGIFKVDYFLDPFKYTKHEKCYDLYLVDLVMPNCNGEELVYQIRNRCSDSIIILMTTYGEGKAIGHCISIGADDYILKPLNEKLFMLRLQTCINNYQITSGYQIDNKRLYQLAVRDALTGLYNKSYFIEAFDYKIMESRRTQGQFSLVVFDLDHFKQVNDEYGHYKGDQVLVEIARITKSKLRGTDIIGRWGGEEFCLLLPNTGLVDANTIAQALRQAIEEMNISGLQKISASFGVTSWLLEDTYESMFKRADNSLYLAKLIGRNKVVTNDELNIEKNGIPIQIEWGTFFESGHSEIDAEHFDLIRLSNLIIQKCLNDNNLESLIESFCELVNHVVNHFENEEKILSVFKYRNLMEHKTIHRELIDKTLKLQRQLIELQSTPIHVVNYLIQDVVVGHLIKSDFDFFEIFL